MASRKRLILGRFWQAAGRAAKGARVQSEAMKNIVCLISGRGSNLAAILQAQQQERWDLDPGLRVAAVLSNRPQAGGLALARAAGVEALVIDHTLHPTREAFEAELARAIDRHQPALVVLAGFLRVLTPGFVARYEGRLVNIHPSLLPAFPGLDTHARALAAGVRVHGATVHFVSSELDAGPIIGQAVVPVLDDDDEERLAARVLAQEHRLLPRCLRLVAAGRIRLEQGRVRAPGVAPAELAVLAP